MDRSMQPTSGNANRRRFSDEQIKFLEFMFEAESRPEAQIKQQLANELGLQPRQVSIWFQNRRARLKTKQVEREYNRLKASHDALASRLESLKRENQSLLIQLKKLKNVQARQQENKICGLEQTESCKEQRPENRGPSSDSKEKLGQLFAGCSCKEETISSKEETRSSKEETLSSNQDSRNIGCSREGTKILNHLTESKDGSMTSSDWHRFASNYLLDESTCSSQWWEFLS
ncbi:hypothetical protein JCGZ_20361 [Jatropha curcas]|uniref:Homeobox-leucine zipper protein n=1 Tax=Jatropha curcas TaxID=180498 RepID=A0A067JZ10_JATCU|nr:homeobox-leucine zipper protein ATHB-7 [Jatropha curcas]KDP25205.1 hypothetical protein JCGZ_20361 [Jatropha curcas]